MSIRVLAEDVVARIAAGEAVERPASAVKELIENAIDAGATAIHVEVSGAGRQLLRVSDNGAGIPADEAALALKRHATSKLRSADDLPAVSTLGFRGEALASLAAVSQATIITRHRDEAMGMLLKASGGETRQRPIGAPAGTAVTIERLFYNTPARLKFLKNDSTEKRHIHWVVARYAMAYPGIAFILKQEGRERLHTTGSGELADVLAKAFGLEAFKRMLAVSNAQNANYGSQGIGVEGFVSRPELHRARRDRIILFVNGRAVQDSALSHAITQAYEGLLKSGAFPLAVLLIRTPVGFVDVNVHPTKAEVRFRDPQQVFLAAQRAVREALQSSGDIAPAPDLWSESGFTDSYLDYSRARPDWLRIARDELFDEAAPADAPDLLELPARPRTLPVLRVVGQVGASYIVAEGPAGLYLIDQNAAHERLLYEELCAGMQAGSLSGAGEGESQVIMLAPEDARLLEKTEGLFACLGFEIERFGGHAFVVRAQPAQAQGIDSADLLPRMLAYLRRSANETREASDGIAALAWAAALRRGQVISDERMRSLVAKLERCPNPLTSPSGRKVFIHLSSEQLAKEFEPAPAL